MDKLDLEPIDDQKPLDLEPLDLEPIQEEPSTLSDLGLGAAQGATFGFSDELMAALQAAKEVATTEKTLKDLPSLYRQLQEVEQQKIAEARERSPIAFTAGEIGAGILPALFTGGATAAASGARAAAAGAKAAPGFLRGVMGAAKAGAGYGALAAAGTTEKPIEDTGEFVGEVVKGGLAGGTIGGALGAAGRAVKGIAGSFDDSAMVRQSKVAYERGKRGFEFTGERAAERQLKVEPRKALAFEKELISEPKEILGKRISDILEDATSQGKVIGGDTPSINAAHDIQEVLQSKPSIFGDRNFIQEFSSKVDDLAQGNLSPIEANNIRKTVRDTLAELEEAKGDLGLIKTLRRAKDALQDKLDEIPGFTQANEDYSNYLRSTAETIIKKGMPTEAIQTSLSDVSKSTEKLYTEMLGLIRKAAAPGSSSDEKRRTLVALKENLARIERDRPGLLKSIGVDPEKIIGKIKKEADISSISQVMRAYQPQSGEARQLFSVNTGLALTYKGAETLGQTARLVSKSAPVKLASRVYNAAEPELRSMADKLMSNPVTRRFGEGLAGSLDKPGGVARRAILFSIMQSPEARKTLSEMYPGVGEE